MQTRRDQVQAHAFVAGRLVSALLRAEPDAPVTPLRRFTVGMFCGVLAGVILIAGFGVFGYIRPGGNKAFRKPGALIVAKDTGSRYVLVDGALRPVLNYASAKLILGSDLHVVSASRNSLKGVPHGLPVGIPSAPEALPDPADLDAVSWQACSAVRPDAAREDKPFVTLRVGAGPAGPALGPDEALLVATPDGTRHLAWNNRRLRVGQAALGALGYADARPDLVGWAWINALPAGPDLAPPRVPGRGRPGPRVGGQPARVGQVFQVTGAAAAQHFILARDGLAPLSPTGAALALADLRARAANPGQQARATQIDAGALAAAPRSSQTLLDPGLPLTPPALADNPTGQAPCLHITVGGPDGAEVRIALDTPAAPAGANAAIAPLRLASASVGDGPGKQGGPALPVNPDPPILPGPPPGADPDKATASTSQADEVVVEPGGGLLIRALPAPGVADGAKSLLVDTGVRYPLPNDQAAAALGYAGTSPVPVPTILLGLIPAGQPLDPEAAKATQPITP
jgi:type VII secretion protein EccB